MPMMDTAHIRDAEVSPPHPPPPCLYLILHLNPFRLSVNIQNRILLIENKVLINEVRKHHSPSIIQPFS